MLQLLVDMFCRGWNEFRDSSNDRYALKRFPRAFILRVMRRYCQGSDRIELEQDIQQRCYLDHASDGDTKACQLMHMHYNLKRKFGDFL